jgi:peptidoglycan/xylan/chitin deacetylase (PgdA/CDA1 family)
MIRFLGPSRILPAREWLTRALTRTLTDELCLTLDDNLRCQYDVALPVLRALGLTAFWFVPTSVLQGEPDRLQIYRLFRVKHFDEINDFYETFFRALVTSEYAELAERALRSFHPSTYLTEFPFYSEADRRFRYVRDEVLGPQRYNRIMDALVAALGLELDELARDLWMDAACLRELHADGHVVGLHSHTHPTRLAELPPPEQLREYRDNFMCLMELLGEPPTTMSHPCNSYNAATLLILRRLGIGLGFRANRALPQHSALEWPREDHANILREMGRCGSRYSPATNPVTRP